MKPKEVKLSDIEKIFELYEEFCGPGLVPINETNHYAKDVLQNLKRGFGGDYRFGSKWSEISKLQFSINQKDEMSVHFYHNLHEPLLLKRFQKEADTKGKKFDQLANQYLSSQKSQ